MRNVLRVNCPNKVLPNNCAGWIGKEPTADEQEVLGWLKANTVPSRILHIGVGNALLSREFGSRVIQGITKDSGEKDHAAQFNLPVILCNKYDVESYANSLLRPFDCIVDVNIRSYSCCDPHFRDYMTLMIASLTSNGMLLTSQRGLDYLIPTPLRVLKQICPEWSIRTAGNVVVMRPSLGVRFRKWLAGLKSFAPSQCATGIARAR